MRCTECGERTVCIDSGGCGGRGGIYGCPKCDAVFVQTDGGMFSGGNAFEHRHGDTFAEARWRDAKSTRVHKVDWNKEDPHFGEWFWSETPPEHELHYFATEQEAKDWLAIYVKKLHDALPWPTCDKCGKKSTRYGLSMFVCRDCKRHYVTTVKKWRGDDGEWADGSED